MRLTPRQLSAAALVAAGCADPAPVAPPPPAYDPPAAAAAAIAAYDADKDGTLDAAELNACPGLKAAAAAADTDRDRRLSRGELVRRFEAYATGGASVTKVACKVRLNGQPLAGAVVAFVPEPFLGPGVQPGQGTTTAAGVADPGIEGVGITGLAYGVYRVTVSKPDAGGAETLPARYNSATTLGHEVGPDGRGDGLELDLKSGGS